MRLDAGGNAYLGGQTSSTSLAVSPNAFASNNGCTFCQSGYLLKVNSQATATLGGTYVHGGPPHQTEEGEIAGFALGANGNIFLSGVDNGTLPTVIPLIQTN